VSFEIAQQLHASGERVALLAALDASGPRFKRSLGDYVSFAVQGLSHHPLALTRYLVSTRIVSKPVVMPKAAAAASTYSLPAVASSINEAFRRYDPQPYPGHVTWFVNGERAPLAVSQWAEFAGSVERWVFPGSHATIFQPPAIEILAAQVKTCLERAQIGGSSRHMKHGTKARSGHIEA